jgi:SAM-dependent methyltransferase
MADAPPTIDGINQRTMRGAVHEYGAIVLEGLNVQERTALAAVADLVRDARILDLGVGAGRTVRPLRAISERYVGVDYVQEMVDHCRREFPDVRFERSDARALTPFAPASFDLVFFSCNGICMVDHAGRLAILAEVRRLLTPGGVFIFSTCNRNSPQYEARFRLPKFETTLNPVKWPVRLGRFAARVAVRLRNRWQLRRHEVRTEHYAMLNDVCHDYRTMLYFIDLPRQIEQLIHAGFAPDILAFDLAGRPADAASRDGTLTLVARQHAGA